MKFLRKNGLTENFETGIPRTIEAYSHCSKKHEFKDSENFFIVYLPNLNYNDQINDQINFEISDFDLAILRCIKKNQGIKVSGIYEKLSSNYKILTLDMIRNPIKREIGDYIELRGAKKTGGYFVK